jgi:hypothetical protein
MAPPPLTAELRVKLIFFKTACSQVHGASTPRRGARGVLVNRFGVVSLSRLGKKAFLDHYKQVSHNAQV